MPLLWEMDESSNKSKAAEVDVNAENLATS